MTLFRSPFIDDDDSWPKDILSIKEEPVESDEEIEVSDPAPSVFLNYCLGVQSNMYTMTIDHPWDPKIQ